MAERLCLIDLGSNAVRLAVFEATPIGPPRCIEFHRKRVRLSEGMDAAGGVLQPRPIERTVAALKEYAEFCEGRDCDVLAVATSAVRDAVNRVGFVALVVAETGLTLHVQSVSWEGFYAYVAANVSLPSKLGWVVEIGGGSAQVSRVTREGYEGTASAPLGAVRASARYPLSDPPTTAELSAMRTGLSGDLTEFGELKPLGGVFVGIGGTVKSLGRIALHRLGRGDEDLHGFRVTLDLVREVTSDLASLELEKRKVVPGMDADRADVILAGLVLLELLMEAGGYDELIVCRYGIREGIAYDRLSAGPAPPGD